MVYLNILSKYSECIHSILFLNVTFILHPLHVCSPGNSDESLALLMFIKADIDHK